MKILERLIEMKEAKPQGIGPLSIGAGDNSKAEAALGRILEGKKSQEVLFLDSLSDAELRAAVAEMYLARRAVDGASGIPDTLESWSREALTSTLHDKSASALRRYLAAKEGG